jgi:hypothetical protein
MMTNKLRSSNRSAVTTFVFLVVAGLMISPAFMNSHIQVANAHSKKVVLTQIQNCGNGGNSGDGGKAAAAGANSPISTAAAAASGGPGGIGGTSDHSTCINNANIN